MTVEVPLVAVTRPLGSIEAGAGRRAGTHTHTSDLWLVVIKGAYLYKDDAGDKRVGPGEFLWIPGGHKHWSGGDKTEGAFFYEEGSKKFDLIPAK